MVHQRKILTLQHHKKLRKLWKSLSASKCKSSRRLKVLQTILTLEFAAWCHKKRPIRASNLLCNTLPTEEISLFRKPVTRKKLDGFPWHRWPSNIQLLHVYQHFYCSFRGIDSRCGYFTVFSLHYNSVSCNNNQALNEDSTICSPSWYWLDLQLVRILWDIILFQWTHVSSTYLNRSNHQTSREIFLSDRNKSCSEPRPWSPPPTHLQLACAYHL